MRDVQRRRYSSRGLRARTNALMNLLSKNDQTMELAGGFYGVNEGDQDDRAEY